MPNLTNSQEWLHQSSLLLQARPRTARVVTKYTIEHPSSSKPPLQRKRRRISPSATPVASTLSSSAADASSTSSGASDASDISVATVTAKATSRRTVTTAATPISLDSSASQRQPADVPQQPRATWTLKTYDPVSGVCLKYYTDKGWEVGRLVASLGQLGREMCALPQSVPKPSAPLGAETPNKAEGEGEVTKETTTSETPADQPTKVEASKGAAAAAAAPPTKGSGAEQKVGTKAGEVSSTTAAAASGGETTAKGSAGGGGGGGGPGGKKRKKVKR